MSECAQEDIKDLAERKEAVMGAWKERKQTLRQRID
jgi:hypothetical protein